MLAKPFVQFKIRASLFRKTMKTAFFSFIFIYQSAIGRSAENIELLGTLGESVLLPCYNIEENITSAITRWLKDEGLVASRNYSFVPDHSMNERFFISDNGSLTITGLTLADEGTYLCNLSLEDSKRETNITLQIVSGPTKLKSDISPATSLPNGTLYVQKGSTVSLNCSSWSYPSQNLSWGFQGVTSSNDTLASGSRLWLNLEISNIQPANQGEYSCTSQNALSKKIERLDQMLLVYYSPERHPECTWTIENDSSHVLFNCSWLEGYPLPTLHWSDHQDFRGEKEAMVNVSRIGESLEVLLDRSMLYDGQNLSCTGHHRNGEEKTCSFILKAPYPEGEPLAVALEGSNITLTCTESSSTPPAKTTWQWTTKREDIVMGSKYIISEGGPIFKLTILNISKQDEGVYFCRSENPLAVRELEIFLTVKASASHIGGMFGTFIAVLVLGIGCLIGVLAYSVRDRICLGHGFRQSEEDRSDILHLVESDEEDLFEDTVPRLQSLANGHNTTLVQIHHIPSSNHENQENINENENQEENTDTEELMKSHEDLVIF